MASPDTLRSRSRSSTGSTSSNTTMNEAAPLTPVRPRPQSHGNPPATTMFAQAQNPASNSFRFFDLPRELRDRIYTYALVSPFPFWWPSASSPRHNVALQLLCVSRQMHDEAAPVLYAQNKFLFTHPSDCNMFRVTASPHSQTITSVYLRIREKDLGLWTKYLGSTWEDRSLKFDLPNLKSLWVFLRSGTLAGAPIMVGQPAVLGGLVAGGGIAGAVPGMGPAAGGMAGFHAFNPAQFNVPLANVQHNLGQINAHLNAFHLHVQQQVQALNNPVHHVLGPGFNPNGPPLPHAPPNAPPLFPILQPPQQQQQQPLPAPGNLLLTAQNPTANTTQPAPLPPPPPPPPPTHLPIAQAPITVPHPYPLYALSLRFERDIGFDRLCHSLLPETRPTSLTDIKIVCIVKLPKPDVQRLIDTYPDDLSVDRHGDARTRFRRIRGIDACLEISGYEVGG